MADRIDFPQPPRPTGRLEVDLPAMVDWLWVFYNAAITQQGLLQDSDLGASLEDQYPILFNLGELPAVVADRIIYTISPVAWALSEITAYTRAFLATANSTEAQSVLGISGVVTDAELLAIAGLVSAADKLAYFTGLGTASLADFTAFARTLVAAANETAGRAALGMGTVIPLPQYTVATLPAAASFTGGMIYVSNESGGAVPAFSDSTDWRRVTDRAVVS
jgi:hypothetical protein